MRETAKTLEKVLEDAGLTAKWEARGEARGEAKGKEKEALAIAQNLINLGVSMEVVISATKLAPEKVKELYQGHM